MSVETDLYKGSGGGMWLFQLMAWDVKDDSDARKRVVDLPLWNIVQFEDSASLNMTSAEMSGSWRGCPVSDG